MEFQEILFLVIPDNLKLISLERIKVLWDNKKKELITELEVGDIVLLETGDRVPADTRILECQGELIIFSVLQNLKKNSKVKENQQPLECIYELY